MEVAFSGHTFGPGQGGVEANPGERGGGCVSDGAEGANLARDPLPSQEQQQAPVECNQAAKTTKAEEFSTATPPPLRLRYNAAVGPSINAEDRDASLATLPIDWPERLTTHLRSELRGKPRTPATTAILAGKSKTWLHQFDLHEAGMADSPAVHAVVSRAIAMAQVNTADDEVVLRAMDRSLEHVHRVNDFYGKGVLGWKTRWGWVAIGACAAATLTWALVHFNHRHVQNAILESVSESPLHFYDGAFLKPAGFIRRRMFFPLVRKLCGVEFSRFVVRSMSERTVSPYLGYEGACVWFCTAIPSAFLAQRWLKPELRTLQSSPN
jgi:hypothetical protein